MSRDFSHNKRKSRFSFSNEPPKSKPRFNNSRFNDDNTRFHNDHTKSDSFNKTDDYNQSDNQTSLEPVLPVEPLQVTPEEAESIYSHISKKEPSVLHGQLPNTKSVEDALQEVVPHLDGSQKQALVSQIMYYYSTLQYKYQMSLYEAQLERERNAKSKEITLAAAEKIKQQNEKKRQMQDAEAEKTRLEEDAVLSVYQDFVDDFSQSRLRERGIPKKHNLDIKSSFVSAGVVGGAGAGAGIGSTSSADKDPVDKSKTGVTAKPLKTLGTIGVVNGLKSTTKLGTLGVSGTLNIGKKLGSTGFNSTAKKSIFDDDDSKSVVPKPVSKPVPSLTLPNATAVPSLKPKNKPRAIDSMVHILSLQSAPDINIETETNTNLFLTHMPFSFDEEALIMTFGLYGDIRSVKIMWPRTESEKRRGTMNGFVSFIEHESAREALANVTHINGEKFTLVWSAKNPPETQYSNVGVLVTRAAVVWANATGNHYSQYSSNTPLVQRDKSGENAGVEVTELPGVKANYIAPPYLQRVYVTWPAKFLDMVTIDSVAQKIYEEGSGYELYLKTYCGDKYPFLFPKHTHFYYYLWKLAGIIYKWDLDTITKPLQLFSLGLVILPPKLNNKPTILKDMESKLVDDIAGKIMMKQHSSKDSNNSNTLSETENELVLNILNNLSPERESICSAMINLMKLAKHAKYIINLILKQIDSQIKIDTDLTVSCIYLLSDLLANSNSRASDAFLYKTYIDENLNQLYTCVNQSDNISVKKEMNKITDIWHKMNIFTVSVIEKYKNILNR